MKKKVSLHFYFSTLQQSWAQLNLWPPLLVIQTLLDLGNQCFQNLGIKERIDDYEVFFQDAFYIQFFEHAFPHIDFSLLEQAQN